MQEKANSTLVLIDPGHGYETPGKSWNDFHEWIFNRHLAKYLMFELDYLNIPYYLLVCEDYDVYLRERQSRADDKAKEWKASTGQDSILVCLHANAYPEDTGVGGTETWYYSKAGKQMAAIFQEELVGELGWRDRGVRKGNFWMLKKTSMPAVLTECGFYTNDHEREELSKPEVQTRIAEAHARAIQRIIQQED